MKNKIIRFIIVIPTLLAVGFSSYAEERVGEIPRIPSSLQKHSFGIGLGQTFLTGPFKDSGTNGITPDVYYSYGASYSFDVVANLHYSTHKNLEQSTTIQGLNLGIKSKFYQYDSFSPYVLAGMGLYRPKVTRNIGNGILNESETKLTFGLHLALGADLQLNNNFQLGLLGHYHNPFDVNQPIGPKVEGSYFKLLMVLMVTI